MGKNGHIDGVTEIPFPATPGGPPGVEVFDLPDWTERIGRLGAGAYAAARPAFHMLITVRTGRLPCAVDLTECVVDSGSWLWVRPGQVLRLRPGPPVVEGTVVVFQAGFLDAATVAAAHLDRRAWRLPLAPVPEARGPVRDTLDMLASEYSRLGDLPLEVHVDVVRHLLAVLVLRLAHLPGGHRNRTAGDRTFRRFQRAVEERFTRSHRVEDYAALLGYSVRTLTRATTAAVGVGAKTFIDDRVVLEAKRLLLHTELPAGAIGDRLGFPDASVFTKFFRHRTNETPAAFRTHARARSTGP
jgi:AraC-like DNA-binding protein